jgi:hypothetical protein
MIEKRAVELGSAFPVVNGFSNFAGMLPALPVWWWACIKLCPGEGRYMAATYDIPFLLKNDLTNRVRVVPGGDAIHRDLSDGVLAGYRFTPGFVVNVQRQTVQFLRVILGAEEKIDHKAECGNGKT